MNDETMNEKPTSGAFRMSDAIDAIAPALASAYADMEQATKDAANPYFRSKYADLGSIDAAIRPALATQGVFVLQTTWRTDALNVVLVTRLMHKSGQWIESDVKFVEPQPGIDEDGNTVFPTSQHWGSALTYARRYGLMTAVGLAVSDATDDDGNRAAEHQSRSRATARPGGARQSESGDRPSGQVRFMQSKYPSKCAYNDCPHGGVIASGDEIAYHIEKKLAVHRDCYRAVMAAKEQIEDVPDEPTAEPAKTASAKAEPTKQEMPDDDLPY